MAQCGAAAYVERQEASLGGYLRDRRQRMVAADTARRLPRRPLDLGSPRCPLLRRRLRRLAVADLLAGTGFQRVRDRINHYEHVDRISFADALRRDDRQPASPAEDASRGLSADGCYRRGLYARPRLLANSDHCLRRHHESDSWGCQSLSAARTYSSHADRRAPPTDSLVRAVQPGRNPCRCRRRLDGVDPRLSRKFGWIAASSRHATDVRALWGAGNCGLPAVPAAVAGGGGCICRTASPLGALKEDRLWPYGPLLHRRFRRRLLCAIAARSVALPELRHFNSNGRRHPVLEQYLFGNLLPARGADLRALRAHQHDGIHTPAGEHLPDPGSIRAESAHDDRSAACPQRAVANGCTYADIVCYGSSHPG